MDREANRKTNNFNNVLGWQKTILPLFVFSTTAMTALRGI